MQLGLRPGQLGGVEDDDVYRRLVRSARCGLYLPRIVVYHKIGAQKLTKAYHRRWHTGHGRYYAEMRLADFERSRWRILGVPGHVYRGAATHALAWLLHTLHGDRDCAFSHELQLRFLLGFVRARWGGEERPNGWGLACRLTALWMAVTFELADCSLCRWRSAWPAVLPASERQLGGCGSSRRFGGRSVPAPQAAAAKANEVRPQLLPACQPE